MSSSKIAAFSSSIFSTCFSLHKLMRSAASSRTCESRRTAQIQTLGVAHRGINALWIFPHESAVSAECYSPSSCKIYKGPKHKGCNPPIRSLANQKKINFHRRILGADLCTSLACGQIFATFTRIWVATKQKTHPQLMSGIELPLKHRWTHSHEKTHRFLWCKKKTTARRCITIVIFLRVGVVKCFSAKHFKQLRPNDQKQKVNFDSVPGRISGLTFRLSKLHSIIRDPHLWKRLHKSPGTLTKWFSRHDSFFYCVLFVPEATFSLLTFQLQNFVIIFGAQGSEDNLSSRSKASAGWVAHVPQESSLEKT